MMTVFISYDNLVMLVIQINDAVSDENNFLSLISFINATLKFMLFRKFIKIMSIISETKKRKLTNKYESKLKDLTI